MVIPAMESYTFDQFTGGFTNAARWQATASRSLLLIHDMQRFFLETMPDLPRTKLISNCADLLARARSHDVPVAYTAQVGSMSREQRGLLYDMWGTGMSAEPKHTDIVESLRPSKDDYVLPKWRYSAFVKTDLAGIMRRRRRDQIVICGVYAHVGILATAIDAYSRDIETFLVRDAIADFSVRDHRMALEYAAACCAVVCPTAQVFV
jgi:isochorismate hydrolase